MLTLINPVRRAEPFDHPDWVFEPEFDGFRAAAATVRGRLISRNGDRLRRYEAAVLELLPKGHVFDGALVVLDRAGRRQLNELMYGCGRPTYVAFDLLMADGEDLRPLPLKERSIGSRSPTALSATGGRYTARWVDADLESIVAKSLGDAYQPKLARWHKILNRTYTQRHGRAEWFRERRGR